jgi:hypothetical protein
MASEPEIDRNSKVRPARLACESPQTIPVCCGQVGLRVAADDSRLLREELDEQVVVSVSIHVSNAWRAPDVRLPRTELQAQGVDQARRVEELARGQDRHLEAGSLPGSQVDVVARVIRHDVDYHHALNEEHTHRDRGYIRVAVGIGQSVLETVFTVEVVVRMVSSGCRVALPLAGAVSIAISLGSFPSESLSSTSM